MKRTIDTIGAKENNFLILPMFGIGWEKKQFELLLGWLFWGAVIIWNWE